MDISLIILGIAGVVAILASGVFLKESNMDGIGDYTRNRKALMSLALFFMGAIFLVGTVVMHGDNTMGKISLFPSDFSAKLPEGKIYNVVTRIRLQDEMGTIVGVNEEGTRYYTFFRASVSQVPHFDRFTMVGGKPVEVAPSSKPPPSLIGTEVPVAETGGPGHL